MCISYVVVFVIIINIIYSFIYYYYFIVIVIMIIILFCLDYPVNHWLALKQALGVSCQYRARTIEEVKLALSALKKKFWRFNANTEPALLRRSN